MKRIVCFCIFSLAFLAAQEPSADFLTGLRQGAEKRGSEWEALARGLDSRVARLLPCDPRAQTAVEEVSRASEARLTALSQYLQAAAAKAKSDADGARRAIAAQAASAAELAVEAQETEAERIAYEAQLGDLRESAKRRAALTDAQKKLASISAISKERSAHAADLTAKSNALTAALRDLDTSYQARQTALQNQLIALGEESSRWGEYYAARLARSQTECAVTNQAPARAPQRKKQP